MLSAKPVWPPRPGGAVFGGRAPSIDAGVRVPHDPLPIINHATRSTWRQTPKLEQPKALPWGDLTNHPQAAPAIGYSHPAPNNREAVALPWGTPDEFSTANTLAYSHPAANDRLIPIISGPYWYPRWCVWQYTAPKGDQLIFRALSVPIYAAPAGLELVFNAGTELGREHICYDGTWNGPKDAYWYQPHDWEIVTPDIRSFYLIMNNISLKRVSDNVPIPIMDMSISTDMDSWCWSLSANLRRAGRSGGQHQRPCLALYYRELWR